MDNSGPPCRLSRAFITSSAAGGAPGYGIVWQKPGAPFSLDPAHLLARAGQTAVPYPEPAAARLNDGRVMVYGSMGR
ncbi:hypothetical protein KIF59_20200 [Enterobacter cloacae subsp. cloacae]|nr:hypothetical protein [Enterobacter cloacae subsp. cloacae]